MAGEVLFGVAGWSYEDWKDVVYPRNCKDPLRAVAQRVDLIEINSTFYAAPQAKNCRAWVERTADLGTRFTAKLPQQFTHGRRFDEALVAQVRRWLEGEQPPPLAELARRSGYSQWHLQRGAERAVGMLPKSARDGGRGERITAVVVACSLGRALVAATARGLCAILLGDDDEALFADLRARFPHAEHQRGDRAFSSSVRAAIACVDGQATDPGLPLDVRGTAFQQRVWTALRALPAGRTIDYAGLARCLGLPRGARAVAAACATNPLAVVVPCHRVVRGDGELAGYRWGIERKRALLAREGVAGT